MSEKVNVDVFSFVDVSVECFDKARKGRPIMPLQSQKGFETIFDGSRKSGGGRRSTGGLLQPSMLRSNNRSRSLSPIRRARSLSPLKEPSASTEKDSSQNQRSHFSSTPKATGTSSGLESKRPGSDHLQKPNADKLERTNKTPVGSAKKSMFPSIINNSPYSASNDHIKLKMSHGGPLTTVVPVRSGVVRRSKNKPVKAEEVKNRGS